MEVEAAEDDCFVNCRSRVLICLYISSGSDLPLIPAEGYEVCSPVYEDNNVCMEWSNNVISRLESAKHIDICKHFAHKAVCNGHLRLVRVDTSNQLVDVFTKGLHP